MSDQDPQIVLNRILSDLKSGDGLRQHAAILELQRLTYSSEAILIQLENLALGEDVELGRAALRALDLETSQFIAKRLSTLSRQERGVILREIDGWGEDGVIEQHRAEVLKRRYDFDSRAGIPAQAPSAPEPEARPMEMDMGAGVLKTASQAAPRPAIPRPSLTQVLLSETSIRIYLYLGAFLVIASAAILAALVEAARLPILLAATGAFAAAAIGFRKRLPQPSFAFAIVFSFLLPIDAGVVAELLRLSAGGIDAYWGVVYLVMTVIWAFGTWYYESRAFSMASFLALILGLLSFSEVFNGPAHWNIFVAAFGNLVGLVGVLVLNRWKGRKFVQPLFFTTHLSQVILVLVALGGLFIDLVSRGVPTDGWIAYSLIFVASAFFYAASDLLVPFVLFPWVTVASLFLIPWLVLSFFKASALVEIGGFGVWAGLAALGSELAGRSESEKLRRVHFPLLVHSLPLFMVSILWGFVEGAGAAFAALLGTAIVYTFVHALRPRWVVWMAALLAGLGAYFTFFALPFMQQTEVYPGYQLLGAGVLLWVPELFIQGPLSMKRTWIWVPVALGTFITGLGMLFIHGEILASRVDVYGEAAIMLGVYAIMFAAYALRLRLPWIGYLATISAALTVVYALEHFDLLLWLPALTGLSVIYYASGYVIARSERLDTWGTLLIRSGLGLGALISALAVFKLESGGGWYVLLLSALVVVELFTRRVAGMEQLAETLLTFSLILLLNDFKVHETTWYLFGSGLIWLTCDLVFTLTLAKRAWEWMTRAIGGSITAAGILFIILAGSLGSGPASACFAVYTLFFSIYALVHKNPRLGYLSTAGAAAAMFYALDVLEITAWLPLFTGLSLIYYFAGFRIRQRSEEWSATLRFSGLALGSLTALIAFFQLEATGGWYAGAVALAYILEAHFFRNGWFEAGVHPLFSIAAILILRDLDLDTDSYLLLALGLIWLGGDLVFEKFLGTRKVSMPVRLIGGLLVGVNAWRLISAPSIEAAICFGGYTVFFAVHAWLYRKPPLMYLSTTSLPLAVYFGLQAARIGEWLFPLTAIAVVYYGAGYFLRRAQFNIEWTRVLLFSGLGLGTFLGLIAPLQAGGAGKIVPIVVAATLYAMDAFARTNVWLAFPANALYLIAYFTLLVELDVNEPQYFSMGAALLGMAMHYLLRRAGSRTGAFVMGLASQLVLLGTTYIQMVSLMKPDFFFVLFVQSLVVLVYGILMRSRSLVIAPIAFVVLGVVTVVYNALKDLSLVVIIGITGLILLSLGVVAVVMRERITTIAERFSDWNP